MNRKWLAFPLSAGILIVLGITAGPGLLRADDDESPLGKIMEKVNKHNSTITKGTRTKVAFAKDQKKVYCFILIAGASMQVMRIGD